MHCTRKKTLGPNHFTFMHNQQAHITTLTNVSIFKNSEEIRIEITLLGSVTNKHHITNQTTSQPHNTLAKTKQKHTTTNLNDQIKEPLTDSHTVRLLRASTNVR